MRATSEILFPDEISVKIAEFRSVWGIVPVISSMGER